MAAEVVGRYVVQASGCWEWIGATGRGGYGVLSAEHAERMAHRAMYVRHVGPIAEGMTLDHLCRNPGCVNPDHLEPVTLRENILRGTGPSAENARKTHCPRGHVYAGTNVYVDPAGRRHCRTCVRRRQREHYSRTKGAPRAFAQIGA